MRNLKQTSVLIIYVSTKSEHKNMDKKWNTHLRWLSHLGNM